MKAVFLAKPGEPLKIVDAPEPKLQASGCIVRILAAPVLSFMKKVVSGELGYAMATPWIPGANGVGVLEDIADDVIGLSVGDHVFIDPYVYTHTATEAHDGILIGLTALTPDSASLQYRWRHGTFAEKALIPAECLTVIDVTSSFDSAQLATLSFAAIAYGGLLKGEFRPGQTLIVTGATGNIGSSAILVALAMGAKRVVAVGREENVLDELRTVDPDRVQTVKLKGDLESDKRAIQAAGGPADLVYDMLGNARTFEPTSSAIHALRRGGTAVLMGGVQAAIDLPYSHVMLNELTITGAFMYPRNAPRDLVNMVKGGILNLSKLGIRRFPLEQVQAALDFAEHSKGPLYTMLVPQ
jgi:alcohol dehydrogenase